jgi:hypothetical protein
MATTRAPFIPNSNGAFGLPATGDPIYDVESHAAQSGSSVSDTAYDATTWNGDTTSAPSKNAVRDKIEALSGVIGLTDYFTNGTYSIVATSLTDVDAVNLAVSFTVPSTGKVLVRLTATADGSSVLAWGLREGSTTVGDPQCAASSSTPWQQKALSWHISGLTPGAAKTYKWGALVNSGTGHIYVGNAGNGAFVDHCLMEVWAVNL